MSTALLVGSAMFVLLVSVFVLPAMYLDNGWFKFWFHDILGWHQPDEQQKWNDGCSLHARCKWCGEEIMQDSQGNWF